MGTIAAILVRIGARLALWLGPILLVALGQAFRKYRWPIYYRLMAYRPRDLTSDAVPRIIGLAILALLGFAVLLFMVVRFLAPVP